MIRLLIRYFRKNRKNKRPDYLNNPPQLRKDVSNIKVQDDVYLQVYWKVLEIGKGPAVVLFVFGEEILKFDCFGKDRGHYHVNGEKVSYGNKIFFEECNSSEQIDKTILELGNNLKLYLQQNIKQKVRELEIDQKNLEEALSRVKSIMVQFLETRPELSGI